MSKRIHKQVVQVPRLTGCHLTDAIKQLSTQTLNVRILEEKEDNDLPEGTVIGQFPQASYHLKPGQSVFLVSTRRPPKPRAQSLYNQRQKQAHQACKKIGIRLRTYDILSCKPLGTCIAQEVACQAEIEHKQMVAYISSGTTPWCVMPLLKGQPLKKVVSFLKEYNIQINVSAENKNNLHKSGMPIVKEQRPLAGSIVNMKKLKKVHLKIMYEH